jgi:uncharacterized protein YodC (DUF2158 family)
MTASSFEKFTGVPEQERVVDPEAQTVFKTWRDRAQKAYDELFERGAIDMSAVWGAEYKEKVFIRADPEDPTPGDERFKILRKGFLLTSALSRLQRLPWHRKQSEIHAQAARLLAEEIFAHAHTSLQRMTSTGRNTEQARHLQNSGLTDAKWFAGQTRIVDGFERDMLGPLSAMRKRGYMTIREMDVFLSSARIAQR